MFVPEEVHHEEVDENTEKRSDALRDHHSDKSKWVFLIFSVGGKLGTLMQIHLREAEGRLNRALCLKHNDCLGAGSLVHLLL